MLNSTTRASLRRHCSVPGVKQFVYSFLLYIITAPFSLLSNPAIHHHHNKIENVFLSEPPTEPTPISGSLIGQCLMLCRMLNAFLSF